MKVQKDRQLRIKDFDVKNMNESEKADLGKIRDTYWELGEMSMIVDRTLRMLNHEPLF